MALLQFISWGYARSDSPVATIFNTKYLCNSLVPINKYIHNIIIYRKYIFSLLSYVQLIIIIYSVLK